MTTEPVSMTGSIGEWTTAPLVVLDLEGSGAQEHDDEAILEIAFVPVITGLPDIPADTVRQVMADSGLACPPPQPALPSQAAAAPGA
jgi:hypothetical protein